MDAAEARTPGTEIKTSTSRKRKRRLTLKCLICLTTYFTVLSISPIRACGEAQLNPTPSDNRGNGQIENTPIPFMELMGNRLRYLANSRLFLPHRLHPVLNVTSSGVYAAAA